MDAEIREEAGRGASSSVGRGYKRGTGCPRVSTIEFTNHYRPLVPAGRKPRLEGRKDDQSGERKGERERGRGRETRMHRGRFTLSSNTKPVYKQFGVLPYSESNVVSSTFQQVKRERERERERMLNVCVHLKVGVL